VGVRRKGAPAQADGAIGGGCVSDAREKPRPYEAGQATKAAKGVREEDLQSAIWGAKGYFDQ
jgi:hypothetical protein